MPLKTISETGLYKTLKDIFASEKFLWGIVVYGILCRLTQYLAYRSLWVDEAKYAVKIMDYSYLQIFDLRQVTFDPFTVRFETAGPLGFFYLSKFLTQILGSSEYILRLIPFVASIAALFLMVRLVKKYLEPLGVAIAAMLLAIDMSLIIRSADFHPYASDVAVTLLLLLMVEKLRRDNLNLKSIFFYGLLGAIAVWLSLPAVFVLVGLGSALIIEFLLEKRREALPFAAAIIFLWLASFAVCYFVYLRLFTVHMAWPEGGYVTSILDIKGLWQGLRDVFTDEPMRFKYWHVPAALFFLGCMAVFLKDKKQWMYLSFPILAALAAAALGKYPFSGRLIIFLTPIFLIFIAEGVVSLDKLLPRKAQAVLIVLLIFLLLDPFIASAKRLIKPIYREEIRPVIVEMEKLRKKGEPVYVYAYAGPAFHYYAKRLGLNENEFIIGRYHHGFPETELAELNALKGRPRVWIVYDHVNNIEGRQFLSYLDQIGEKQHSYLKPGAGLLLYNLRN